MAITFNELDHPRESGKFIDKEQSSPETTLVPQSATSREVSVRERLMGMGDMSPLNYGPMEHGFDRNFHANPDSARLAELGSEDALNGIVAFSHTADGEDSHYVVLARLSASGEDGQTFETYFSTPEGTTPTTAAVLESFLTSSATLNDVESIDDWANLQGFDLESDGRAVRAAYEAALEQDAAMRVFLADRYDEYLWGDQ